MSCARMIDRRQRWRYRLKNLLPQTLFGRALLIIVTPLVLVQLITTIIFYDRHWQQISRRLSSAVVGELALTVELLAQYPNDPAWQRWLFDQVARNTSLLFRGGSDRSHHP